MSKFREATRPQNIKLHLSEIDINGGRSAECVLYGYKVLLYLHHCGSWDIRIPDLRIFGSIKIAGTSEIIPKVVNFLDDELNHRVKKYREIRRAIREDMRDLFKNQYK
jgi:hypothetical protein